MKTSAFILIVLLWPTLSFGQSLFESSTQNPVKTENNGFSLNGYVRGSAFGAGEQYDYTQTFGELSLQTNLKKDNLLLKSDIRFRSGTQFHQTKTEIEVKEAYAGFSTRYFDLLLGEKIESWGRTDGFNPTNNITPNNYFFFSANPDDQKLPNFMLKADVRIGLQVNWELIVLPIFRPSVYRYDLFNMGQNVNFSSAVLPELTFTNAALASKINVELSGIGFSASWFSGYDPFYGFDLQHVDFSTGIPIITYLPSFYRKNTPGLDFTMPVGTWIVRGEGALNLTKNPDKKMYIPKNDLSYVFGLEHDFGGYLTIVQYIGKFTPDFEELVEPVLNDPANPMAQLQYANELIAFETTSTNRKIFHQEAVSNHALSLTVSKYFAYETFQLQITGYYNFTSEETLFRPKFTWKPGGNLNISAGYSSMQGPDKSVFNYAAPLMNGAFIEIKASF
ncbi:MAG: hypothetical protein JXR22_02095 [Prolixibacteraceae bacterium]|nr:hypothetical protein [Prolixibacteraceae bacterium]